MKTTETTTSKFPAGWYPVADRPNTQGYWDGEKWTGEYAPLTTSEPQPIRLTIQKTTRTWIILAIFAAIAILMVVFLVPALNTPIVIH